MDVKAGVLFRKDHRLKVPDNTVLKEMLDSGSKAVTVDPRGLLYRITS
jgi:hypothetical protein